MADGSTTGDAVAEFADAVGHIDHVTPAPERLADLAAGDDDGPVVMVNLNRYRDVAEYPADHPDHGSGISGAEAYLRYGAVALPAIEHVGGHLVWMGAPAAPLIGCDHDAYDEVVLVWYPNHAAFLRLGEYPGYLESHVHRNAGVAHATLLPCPGGTGSTPPRPG
jgi:uncharacterized protein (DUF1330 family)